MKRIAVFLLLFISCSLSAQKIEKYFDYTWKECPDNEARFYAVIRKTDSGWFRNDFYLIERKLQMQALYKDSACTIANGHFTTFHANGKLHSKGVYKDNQKEGLWLSYHPNGFMSDSTVYENGIPVGTSLQWYNNGFPSDSTVYNEDGSAVKVGWFDDGSISEAGRLSVLQKLHGKWQFFHKNGKQSALETYNNGVLVDRKYFTEEGLPMTDTTDKTHSAEFAGGIKGWGKYLEKNLYFPTQYQIVNAEKAVVVVEFMIDENGKVNDVHLQTPFHPAFNDIALKVVRSAPKWQPAMNHNRRVSYTHRQAVFFTQTRE